MSALKVAIDARLAGSDGTGDSAYWDGLLHGLSLLEGDFRFLLFFNKEASKLIPDSNNFEKIVVKARSGRLWSLVSFPMAARRMGAQVIHSQYNISPLCGRIGVTTIHDVSFFVGPEWFKPRDRLLLRRWVPKSVARAAKVLTVSETSRQEIERFIPAARGKVVVTPNALPVRFHPMSRSEGERIVREELHIELPFLLSVGTRWPRKNMALAESAVTLLPESLPHKLVLTGKAGWGDERAHPRIVRTGYVTDEQIAALYASASLYLAPSLHEGFGIPLLEAWASSCPVLCSSGGALPEVAGDAAFVETSWDPKVWAERIEALLADSSKLETMCRLGHERVKMFSWMDTAEKTVAVYREVAG